MNIILDNPLSNRLIEKYFDNKANIKTFNEIYMCNTIDQIFNGHDHCIVFLENESSNIGHWVLLYRNNLIYYFDSFGFPPFQIFKIINPNQLRKVGKVLKVLGGKIQYNTVNYQEEETSTCGRWAIFILFLFKTIRNFDFDLLKKMMDILRGKHNYNFDEIVCYFIDQIDRK